MMKALLFISHGSRSEKSGDENRVLCEILKEKSGIPVVECAFLDVSEPTIPQGVEACIKQGATDVVVLLNFLNSGNHVLKDIPEIIRTQQQKYPEVIFHLKPPVGQHPKMVDLFLEQVHQVEK